MSATAKADAAWREVARVALPTGGLGHLPLCLDTSHDLEAAAVVGAYITSPIALPRATDRA